MAAWEAKKNFYESHIPGDLGSRFCYFVEDWGLGRDRSADWMEYVVEIRAENYDPDHNHCDGYIIVARENGTPATIWRSVSPHQRPPVA